MSTSIVYHQHGVREIRFLSFHPENGAGVFTVELKGDFVCCPVCGSRKVVSRGGVERVFKSLPVGKKPTFIVMRVPRVECAKCGVVRQVAVPFADERGRLTHSLERYVADLCRHMTMQAVAEHLGLRWETVRDVQRDWLARKFRRPKLKHLRQLGVDEIAVGKGHKYLTVVLDLKTGVVVFVGEGKGADALEPFWRKLKAAKAKIEVVSMDMSQAFVSAVSKNLPEAMIVFDHFHVMKLANHAVDKVRRRVTRKASDEAKADIKGKRWLLLKNYDNLDSAKKEPESLDDLMAAQAELAFTYLMKEQLRDFWKLKDVNDAKTFLAEWLASAADSGIPELKTLAETLAKHEIGLLSRWLFPVSNGIVEGTNNKIKTMTRQAYGFRDKEFLKLKIMAIHLAEYELVG